MSTLSQRSINMSLDDRVEDYLDDRLQSVADLDGLEELLANVETQRTQLQTQLNDAVRELEAARLTFHDRQAFIDDQIADFRQLQTSIDERVKTAAASDAPSQAIARLQQPMSQVQSLGLAKSYFIMLQDVEQLRRAAQSHLPGRPKEALQSYAHLKELALRLRGLPDHDTLHLVEYIQRATESLWDQMKLTLSAELEGVLERRHWPKMDPRSRMDDEWIACIDKLLDLQMPEIVHSTNAVTLLPLEIMARMFVVEFRFHFLSDKPSSSPQSVGTHCFPWVLATLEKWEDFFRDNLGHLLAAKFHDTPVAAKMVYVDPVSALIRAMLPVVQEKVTAVIAETEESPVVLSILIAQLISLDECIRTRFNYDGGDADGGWRGLVADVLDAHFEAWFEAERKFSLDRFETIVASQDGRRIDYNFSVAGKMKPTLASIQVTDLLRAVTTKYEGLRRVKQKLRFLVDVQLDILDGYYDRLRGSLEAYQSLTSTLGRTLHGVTKEQQAALEGTGALETLCKVIGSCDHIATTLMEWSDEEVFVVLWDQLHKRDSRGIKKGIAGMESEGGGGGGGDIKGRTSAAVTEGDENGAIFDETVSAYRRRGRAAEELLVGALADSHGKSLRAYLQSVEWTSVGDPGEDAPPLSTTPELDEPLRTMNTNFEFLGKTLSTASLRRVWHEALDRLQDQLWGGLLMRRSFTAVGAAQFAHDVGTVAALVDHYIPGGSAALDTLREGAVLLSVDSRDPTTTTTTLKEASDRVFRDNEEARRVLSELGLVSLTAANARQILQRRVENSESIGW